ncbi:UvrD-helicase domain-containing protein [Acinetobacter sp. MD2]|uniref:UvrD-helicase domain-containing protein n=1 Tax=Acinetobacter sp. MD2 TaxID=2600066 RepID=UPI002D1F34DA|nr:UvrD-helicase domain-containing protein [Acinetobacter sp. MD2]MEB3767000.1 UvrD-helicase domain-containing protein [Acinetobacter sp. MD2]
MNLAALSYQPIEDIYFSGLHWIEASAGSGKTYTLSSLMVRILLEKYLPRQVVATTFTRAAAAELKARIRQRLLQTYRFFDARREGTQVQNEQLAVQLKNQDPLHAILLTKFAGQVDYACARLKLVIDQLDELFVGTLDSFSQKLLREFAFESGRIERSDMTDNAKQYTQQLIHDILREWIQAQPQSTIDWLYASGDLKPADAYLDVVESSLNFSSAQLQTTAVQAIDFTEFSKQRLCLKDLDFRHLEAFYLSEGEYFAGVSGTYFKKDAFSTLFAEVIPAAIQLIQMGDGQAFFQANFAEQRKRIFKFLELFQTEKIFSKKCSADAAAQFYQDTALQTLCSVLEILLNVQQNLEDTATSLKLYLCQQVKLRLPEKLQHAGETTFSQQIRTLSEALRGSHGQLFSAAVHQAYPLILVDEFQDTNQDQDNMLASIWRHPQRYARGCMIMVGDRKQAIYGFRGGDMLTFVQAHQDVIQKSGRFYQLQYNHRSVAPLVEVVDALFQQQPDFGEQVIYHPVFAGQRPHPALVDHGQKNPLPLRWLLLEDKAEHPKQVVWQITNLLNQARENQLYFDADSPQPLGEDDIAVLSKNHDGLDKVQFALEKMAIRVNRPAKRSVFDHSIAKDVGAVLTAILHPYDENKLRRALLSRLFNFTLSELLAVQAEAQGFADYIDAFNHIRELWFEQQFLTAWQYCLQRFDIWQRMVAIPSPDNERVVVNLRHLTELLSEHSRHHSGPQHLYQWYLKQLGAPKEREWELERPLSNAEGVKLMTIHQSKGLEFKVVFLLNADGTFKDQNDLNFSTIEQLNPITSQLEQRRVITIPDAHLSADAKQQHSSRAEAEQHRLWYVALTRASHRVYALLSDPKAKSKTGLGFWKNHAAFSHENSGDAMLMFDAPHLIQATTLLQQAQSLDANALPMQRFYPATRTSFTALAQHLSRAQIQDRLAAAPELNLAAADETQVAAPITASLQGQKLAWIRQNFVQGTQAGTFLHTIFEHLDFQDHSLWTQSLERRFKNTDQALWQQLQQRYAQAHQLPENLTAEDKAELLALIQQWLLEIIQTPMHGDFCLAHLETKASLAEFPFYMALSDRVFATQRIQALFTEYGYDMPNLNPAESARFLKGEIDLVYQHQQKFYIADYKSNYLGANLEDYSVAAIQQNMSMSSYWLQAAIYLVALHRYLKVRLNHYVMEQHLGGASYLYLRGMQADTAAGVLYWQPDFELILRLDAILGYSPQTRV